jgi:hypothetical protein
MLSDPQIVSTNKKWALGPVLFFNFVILSNSRFGAKTTGYKWERQVQMFHPASSQSTRYKTQSPCPGDPGGALSFIGRLAVTYFRAGNPHYHRR